MSHCALWLQKIACSFHVGNVDDLHTDRHYYKKPKSTYALFAKIVFIIKIWIYVENIKTEMLYMVVLGFIILTWWCQSFLMPRGNVYILRNYGGQFQTQSYGYSINWFLVRYLFYIQEFRFFFLKLTPLSCFDNPSIPVFYIKGSIIQFCRSSSDDEDGGMYIGKNIGEWYKTAVSIFLPIFLDCFSISKRATVR